MIVQDVYNWIDHFAPFASQEGFDNAGLLVGAPDWEVLGIHTAMDVTDSVLDEAEAAGANLIITHHPMMFGARKTMREDDFEGRLLCRMIRARIALIAVHTNLDQAPGGINEVLAKTCGLSAVTGEGYLRAGSLPEGLTLTSLVTLLERVLHTTIRVMGQATPDKVLHRMAVASGAGSDFWEDAHAMGAEVFLSGEIKHHHALAMNGCGMIGLEAGHFATEEPGIFALADALQNHLNAVQCDVCVSKSRLGAYALPSDC